MGYRVGAAKALEKLDISYLIWSEKAVKNSRKAEEIILRDFPRDNESLNLEINKIKNIDHVIALTEAAVVPASLIRHELKLRRNSKSVILRCTDKLKMKRYLNEKEIPMAKFLSSTNQSKESLISELGFPLVSKVKYSSGGRGVFVIEDENEIQNYIKKENYFESLLKGKEGSIESFVNNSEIIFTNITQYYKNGECNILPAHYSKKITSEIKKLNTKVINSLNIKWGMTHLEYYITKDGILFGEIALRPPGGYIMEVLENCYDYNFWDLFVRIETNQLIENLPEFKKNGCSIVIHPGDGVVSKISGFEKTNNLKSIKKFKLKMKVGDHLEPRLGVGNDYGYIIMANEKIDQLNNDIENYYNNFQITLKN